MSDRLGRLVAVARPDVVDGLRSRRLLAVRALTPLALFVVVLGVSLATGRLDQGSARQDYRVAVEGDLAGASDTLREVGGDRLTFVAVDDAALGAAEELDAGLRVPDELDRLVAEGAEPTVELFAVTSLRASRATTALLEAGFADVGRAELVAAAGLEASVLELTVTDVELTSRGTRILVAELVAAVLVLQGAMLVGATANRFVARRGRGLVQGRLLLPVSRTVLALGTAGAELVVGLVASSLVLVPALVLAAGTRAAQGGLLAAALAVVTVVVSAVVLAGLFAAFGLVVGVRAQTPEQVTLATGAGVVAATVVAALVGLGAVQAPPVAAVVPVVGVVSEVRATLSGTLRPVALVVAWATTLGLGGWLVARSGRALDAERLVRRGG